MKKNLIAIVIAVVIVLSICSAGFATVEYYNNWTQRQNIIHEIANLARSIDLPETDPIITRAQEIWWEDYSVSEPTISAVVKEEEKVIDFYNGILSYEITYNADTEYLAVMFAKTVFYEARGIYSIMEQAAVIQTVYNRTRSSEFNYSTLYNALTASNQFAYFSSGKTVDDYGRDLIALARDVIYRNTLIDQGYAENEVGIVLAAGYCYYSGDGHHNYFRNAYRNGIHWDWSLPNPYES